MPKAARVTGLQGRRVGDGAVGVATVVADAYFGLASASANSAAVPNRSAGSFSKDVSTAASMCDGMVWRWGSSGRGVSVTTRATMAWAVEPVNGGSPVSIS